MVEFAYRQQLGRHSLSLHNEPGIPDRDVPIRTLPWNEPKNWGVFLMKKAALVLTFSLFLVPEMCCRSSARFAVAGRHGSLLGVSPAIAGFSC